MKGRVAGGGVAWIVLFVLSLGGGFLGGRLASGGKKEIRGRSFVMVDSAGKVRASIRMAHEEPGLFLYDRRGEERASLRLDGSGSALNLETEDRRNGIRLSMMGNGRGAFYMIGAGSVSMGMGPGEAESTALLVEDGEGGVWISEGSMRLDGERARLEVRDAGGGPRFIAPLSEATEQEKAEIFGRGK